MKPPRNHVHHGPNSGIQQLGNQDQVIARFGKDTQFAEYKVTVQEIFLSGREGIHKGGLGKSDAMAFDYSTLENQPGIISPYELNEDQYAAVLLTYVILPINTLDD